MTPERKSTVRVLIIEDHPLYRLGLARFLGDQPGLEVCGEASSVTAGLEAVERLQPDVMLIDLSLEDSDGMDLLRQATERHPQVRTIVLSMHDEVLYAERAIKAGAYGYVEKHAPPDEVLAAVREALVGRVYVSPSMARRAVGRLSRPHGIDQLTGRELEVLDLLGQGLSTREIARRMAVSHKTVHTYREHLKSKLQLGSAARLTRYAVARWLQVSKSRT